MCNLCTYMNHKDYDRSKKKNTHGPILSYAKDLTLFHICLPDFNKQQ